MRHFRTQSIKAPFVSVADKIIEDELDETIESDFSFYKTLPCDYSTAEFIQDNKLNTHIRKKYDKSLYMIFSSNELIIQDKSISWDNVVSWKYYQRNPRGCR